jgi:hypothetical protein
MYDLILYLLRVLPALLMYSTLFSFAGYIIDPGSRYSGKWYADIWSTIGIFAGIAFALWITD